MSHPTRRRVMLGAGLAALPLSARAQKKSLRLIDTAPPGHAFKPLAESGCPLVKS